MIAKHLVLSAVHSGAETYSFKASDGHGWALCTVNDITGELQITSDWGSWSYRWHADPRSLGAPTLTHFLGDRSDVDYLARKLQREGRYGQRFSPIKTAATLCRLLAERRLEDGRAQLEGRWDDEFPIPAHLARRYDENGLPLESHRMPWEYRAGRPWDQFGRPYEALPYLTKDKAREIWDELVSLGDELDHSGHGAEALFWERLQAIDGVNEYISEQPYEHSETEQTSEDKVLRDLVLPALIEACRGTAAARSSKATAGAQVHA